MRINYQGLIVTIKGSGANQISLNTNRQIFCAWKYFYALYGSMFAIQAG